MAKFNLDIVMEQNLRHYETWKGGPVATPMTDQDIGKATMLGGSIPGEKILADEGSDIESFVVSIEPYTQDGHQIITVVRHGSGVRQWVAKGDAVLKDFVVCGEQTTYGKPNVDMNHPHGYHGVTKVKKGDGLHYKWRVIRINGPLALIEAI